MALERTVQEAALFHHNFESRNMNTISKELTSVKPFAKYMNV